MAVDFRDDRHGVGPGGPADRDKALGRADA